MSHTPPQRTPAISQSGGGSTEGWGPPPGGHGPPPTGGSPQGRAPGGPRGPSRRLLVAIVVAVVIAAAGGVVLSMQDGDDGGERSGGERAAGELSGDQPSNGEQAEGAEGEPSGDEQAYVDALIVAANDAGGSVDLSYLDDEELRCWATATVDVVGLEALRELATPEQIHENGDDYLSAVDLDHDQAGAFYDQTTDCIDWRDVLLEGAAQNGWTPEQIDCVDENLDVELLRDFWVTSFAEGAATEELREATGPCGFTAG